MKNSCVPAAGLPGGLGVFLAAVSISFLLASAALAQSQTPLLGLGDSIGEGVQSADASWRTQAFTYLSWIGLKMQVSFPQPLIQSSPLGTVGDTMLRSRISPQTEALNVAVSGADVNSLLNNRADAVTEGEIDSETDLVIFPRLATQIEIAESLTPTWVVCWIGNNDALGAATDWNHLDASQLTSIEEFSSRFSEITQRLGDLPSNVVLGNIPNVTRIGFLMDGQDLIRFLGSDFGLAEGDYTSLVTMLIIKLGLNNGSILQDPDFVLDAGEVALVQERIGAFNEVIQERADLIDAAVVDVHTFVEVFASTPVSILGIPISPRFLGGLLSLDGVHPSETGHALLADAFIAAANSHFGTSFPRLTPLEIVATLLNDPFVDKDGDGRVRGRVGAGLLETLGPFLGISGDFNDLSGDDFPVGVDPQLGESFLLKYSALKGKPAVTIRSDVKEIVQAFEDIFRLEDSG